MNISEFAAKVMIIDEGADRDLLLKIVDILYEHQRAKDSPQKPPKNSNKDLDEIFEQMMNNPECELYNACYKKSIYLIKEELSKYLNVADMLLKMMHSSDPGSWFMRWGFDALMAEKEKKSADKMS